MSPRKTTSKKVAVGKEVLKKALDLTPFTDEPLRFIDEDGHPVADFSLADVGLDEATAVRIYEDMVLTREIDRMAWVLVRQGKAFFHISTTGHEGIFVPQLLTLKEEDWVAPFYRMPASLHVRGIKVEEIFAQFLGTRLDPLKGRQMPGHLGHPDHRLFAHGSGVGSQFAVAIGIARALQYRGKGMCIAYGGDGATSEGHFHSLMNFAGVFNLPVVVTVVNNQYAISVPRSRQTASKTIAIKAMAYGFDGYLLDGNDPIVMYYATRKLADKARAGEGPSLIEALTYRLDPHSSADDDKRYRTEEEVKYWWEHDTLKRMRTFLEDMGLWDEDKEAALRERVKAQIDEAVTKAEEAGLPDWEDLFSDVFAGEVPWHLLEEKHLLEEELKERPLHNPLKGGH